jgi:hypothetical protein
MATVLLAPDLLSRGIDTQPLQTLREQGVDLVVMAGSVAPPAGGSIADGGKDLDAGQPGPLDTALLAEQLRRHASPVFFVSSEWPAVQAAESLGGRAILVLAGRTVDSVVGEAEAETKAIAVASDLAMAGRYVGTELAELQRLGPFRFTQPLSAVSGPSRSPGLSRSDLRRLFALVVLAGLTFALGLAYLLQEAYETIAFPKALQWPVRFLTLQWIPQTWRGLMFMLIGMAVGFAVTRLLGRLSRARQG